MFDYGRARERLGFEVPQVQRIYDLAPIGNNNDEQREAALRALAARRAYKPTGIGSKIGGVVGGIAGTYFGPAGTAIGSAIGGAAGNFAEKAMFEDD
jgi:uncharacterized protein YcfJ